MSIYKISIGILALAVAGFARPESIGVSVTIIGVSPFGRLLRPITVTRFEGANGKDFASRFRNGKAESIPTGEYAARVLAGGQVISSSVHVARPNALIVMSGPPEMIERGPGLPGVTGKVIAAGETTPVWVRLVSVFSDDYCCTAVPLSDDGAFSFGAMEVGDYILLVLADGRVLFEKRIVLNERSALITVDLANGKATVEHQ